MICSICRVNVPQKNERRVRIGAVVAGSDTSPLHRTGVCISCELPDIFEVQARRWLKMLADGPLELLIDTAFIGAIAFCEDRKLASYDKANGWTITQAGAAWLSERTPAPSLPTFRQETRRDPPAKPKFEQIDLFGEP